MQGEEERLALFTTAAILGARLIALTSDTFFAAKMRTAYAQFVARFASRVGERGSVAQYRSVVSEVDGTNAILDILSDIEYLELASPAPLLSARCAFMRYKLFIVRRRRSGEQISVAREGRQLPVSANGAAHPITLSMTQEKILGYVKKFPRVRVRDVVRELGTLSDRTVKRGLKELVADGILKKVVVENIVYYTRIT